MLHSVSFGLYLGVCTLAAWTWRWRFGRAGQLAIFLLMPLFLAGVLFSYTRSVWMGVGVGLLIALTLTLRGVWRPLVLGSIVGAGLLLVATQMDQLKNLRRENSAVNAGRSVDLRGAFAYISWQMFLDRPLLGVGFGQFPEAKKAYLADRSTNLDLEATRHYIHHNGLLSILTETGLIGMALYLALLFAWGHTAWQLYRRTDGPDWVRSWGVLLLGALAVYVCQAAFHELSYTTIDNVLIFFLAGTAVGLHADGKAETVAAVVEPSRAGFRQMASPVGG